MPRDSKKPTLPKTVEACHEEIKGLRERLAWFEAQHFGQRADRLPDLAGQPELFEEGLRADPPEDEAKGEDNEKTPAKRKGHGRRDLANLDHIPIRETITHDVSEDEKFCRECGCDKASIPAKVSFRLGIIPAQLFRVQHIFLQYACRCCQSQVVTAEAPMQIIERGMATPELMAHVAVSKFDDHLPLNRQEKIFARHGIDLPRTTLLGWLFKTAQELGALVELMTSRQCNADFLGVDETPVPLQAPGKTHKAYIWTVVGGEDAPYTVHYFERGRSRAGPGRFLKGFQGTLQSDNYAVYSALCADWELRHAGCWAHVRRKFVDAYKVGRYEHAREAVQRIAKLYEIERATAGLAPEERLRRRQEESKALVEAFIVWLREIQIDVPPACALGKAISYALNLEQELKVFLEDARVPIDNNAVERAIRPVVVGRKNWLFAGSEQGGRMAAVYFTLIESAKRHGLNVFDYLADVMRRLPGLPHRRLAELLPDQWKAPAEPGAVAAATA